MLRTNLRPEAARRLSHFRHRASIGLLAPSVSARELEGPDVVSSYLPGGTTVQNGTDDAFSVS